MRSWMALGAVLLLAGTARATSFDPARCRPGESLAHCKARLGVSEDTSSESGGLNGAAKTSKHAVTGTARAAERQAKSAGGAIGGAAASFSEGMGELPTGPVSNTATIDAAGLFDGNGINVQFVHSISRKISGVLGANYSRARAISGSITALGAEVGIDYFLIGQYNEGLRLGARGVGSIGWDGTGNSAGFGDVGVGPELGYNYIASNGMTAGVAAGVDFRLGARLGGNTTGEADVHPYGKVNLGYSW